MKTKWMKILSLIVVIAVSLVSAPPVYAAPGNTNNPQKLEDLFDAQFYSFKYPEVVSVVGNDKADLFKHFTEYGLNEGRTCSAVLNVALYKANYPDVAEAYGNDWDGIVKHYFNKGIKEGRQSFVSAEDIALENILLNGIPVVDQKNDSSILNGINNAIKQASGSQTGYVKDDSTGIIASADGHALIPWDTIQEEGRIQDIEELRRRCGDDLILIRDHNNKIKFVGGRFSNVKVTDETSAIKALDTMAKLYDNDDGRRYLKLSTTGTDSLGNPFYRFVSVDAETEQINSNYTVTLAADKDGNVLGASNANSSSQWDTTVFAAQDEQWGGSVQEYYENAENGFRRLYDGPVKLYDDETKSYYWANYYEKAGIVYEVLVSTIDGKEVVATKFYDAETFHNDPSSSFNKDYEFKNLSNVTEKTFIDFFGNKVTLPVAYEEGKGWYIIDTNRKMICVESSKDVDANTVDSFDKHYFNDEYFNAVEAFTTDGTPSELIENEKNIITAFTTIQHSYDEHSTSGFLKNPKTIYVNFIYDATNDDASQRTMNDYIVFNINNNAGNSDFSGISHEFGHSVVSNLGQNLPYRAAPGAINESYADIMGNLVKMIKKKEGKYSGNVCFARWLIGDFLGNDTEHVIRDMSNPHNNGQGEEPAPIKVNDEYFIKDTGVYEGNDRGGVHQNNSILSHICYRMYNEVFADKDENGMGIPDKDRYRDLLKVWYDSVLYLNHDSTYADVKGYVLQAMKNHGYSQDMISRSEQIFNDANVDAYKPFDPNADNHYDDGDVAAAAKIKANGGELNSLYNLVEGKANSEDAKLDYEIAYDEYQLAKLQGLTGDELRGYEENLVNTRNSLEISERNVKELQSAFTDSQNRLKKMVDDKMSIVRTQEAEMKKVASEKETNPGLERSYRAICRSLKTNIDSVDNIIDSVKTAAIEFEEFEEISEVFSDVWNIDLDDITADEEIGYPEEMPDNLYIGDGYIEEIDDWDYYELWDDFWDEYWSDDDDEQSDDDDDEWWFVEDDEDDDDDSSSEDE